MWSVEPLGFSAEIVWMLRTLTDAQAGTPTIHSPCLSTAISIPMMESPTARNLIKSPGFSDFFWSRKPPDTRKSRENGGKNTTLTPG
jgi:hypothetical protein